MNITAGTIINPIMIENLNGPIDLSSIRLQQGKTLQEELESSKENAVREQELLQAIHSLENALAEGNKSHITAIAKKLRNNFTEGVLAGVVSGALFDAIKMWAQM